MARRHHRARGRPATGGRIAAASLLGWWGVSLGLGVGLPWLVDAGATPASLLGLAALVAGIVALVAAGAWIVRARRGWARLVLVPWLLAVVVGTYSLAIALAATVVPPSPHGAAPSEVAAGREVTFRTDDGVVLHGWYLPGTNGAAVVLRHGSGSQRFSTSRHAAVLAEHGYAVLMVDARGHGASAGRAMDLGWNGEADTTAAVDFLLAQPEVRPDGIGVLGLSMGGEEALGAAGIDSRIHAVVAEGATGRTAGDKDWLSEEYGVAGVVQEQLDRLTYGMVDLLSAGGPPPSLADSVRAAAPTPILLVAAGGVPDEGAVARRLAAVSPDSVAVWVVPAAGHTEGLATDPLGWQRRVLGFLDRALLVDTGQPRRPIAGASPR